MQIHAGELVATEDIRRGVELYRRVMRLGSEESSIGPRPLAALCRHGGIVLGAFAGTDLIGFAYGFLARGASGPPYHYSQAAVVRDDWQGRGVGRVLKRAQRDAALGQGLTRMRWAFDPLRAGNGHFNLDVLGAVGRWFERNLYGVETVGRDAGLRTDRLVVEWDLTLDDPRPGRPLPVSAAPVMAWGDVAMDSDGAALAVPLRRAEVTPATGADMLRLQERVADAVESLLAAGYGASSCRAVDDTTAIYTFRRHP